MTTNSTNFKREGRVVCEHGHNHPNPTAARICAAAWRYAEAQKAAKLAAAQKGAQS